MKWLNLAGQEVESNDNPANVKALKAAGWKLASECQKPACKSKKGNK